ERAMQSPGDLPAQGGMQLGAHYAGIAIEHSMLGATHACANPLTARYGTTHGVAIAALLTHVVAWNRDPRYTDLCGDLSYRLEQLAQASGLCTRLQDIGVPKADLESLAEQAASQWTGRFNPRPFDKAAALEIYECAY